MALISIIIGKKGINIDTTYLLSGCYYLFKYFHFQKKSLKELCNFIARNTFYEFDNNKLEYCYYKNFYFLTIIKNNICICCILDSNDYPIKTLNRLLLHLLSEYIKMYSISLMYVYEDFSLEHPGLFNKIVSYQDPENVDKVLAINNALDETKKIILKNIDKVLARGNDINILVKKSNDLSKSSKKFYKAAKKVNRCCFF
tara:strand:- start:3278 stop:3877 length:600 start_codon:yes stop_codon:yes gene_type:complete